MKAGGTGKPLTQNTDTTAAHFLQIGLIRGALFASIWWILTDGAIGSWLIGAPVVLAATMVSLVMLPASSWSLRRILRFVPFFLWQSIRGGIDVARIVLHPRLPVSPVLYEYSLRLPPGLARVFMVNTVNLLPGTLSVELDAEILRIHVLDETGNFAEEMVQLENLILGIAQTELPKDITDRQV